ncbi:hypothetical protein AB0C90_24775 [Streptomyces sp. NPDC048550]|uniref:hypothetical protein n=1 Tax=Streptomyces sp. NPDC048550 TaxID=3155739 RepID=UPI00343BAE1F
METLTVYCLFRKPRATRLISDQNRRFGGTWFVHQVITYMPTEIVLIGASREKPLVDHAGIPQLISRDGMPTAPPALSTNHEVEINPLFPGHHYFAVVVVTDRLGNWEVIQWEFTAKRRKLTVEFPTIHIFNDGDPSSYGEAGFWFRIFTGPVNSPILLPDHDFHLPTQDIDDWGETDRPYPVDFAFLGEPKSVKPEEMIVSVSSWGVEEDPWPDSNEGAGGFTELPLPTGESSETVSPPTTFTMDCPTTTTDDDFHYGVDVRWSVTYVK